jgi:hypothetical protein
MKIDFSEISHTFSQKPLVIGGKAMQYYGLRESDHDIDLVVSTMDLTEIAQKNPRNLKSLWGDLGVVVGKFEIWKSVNLLQYDQLRIGAIEESDFLVVSLEKMLLLVGLALKKEKFKKDLQLILKKIEKDCYKNFNHTEKENEKIISQLSDPLFIEKKG